MSVQSEKGGNVSFENTEKPQRGFTLMSLNIAHERRTERLTNALAALQPQVQPDILLLQEVEHVPFGVPASLVVLASKLGLEYSYSQEEELKAGTARGLAILSRYRLLARHRVFQLPRFDRIFNPRQRIGLGATLETPVGPLRVYNVHLDTRINARQRLEQLQTILEDSSSFSEPQLIGGDFNTSDIFWFKHVLPVPWPKSQTRRLCAALERVGFSTPFLGTGPTFHRFQLKLDWIFVKGFTVPSYGLEQVSCSDHRALWVKVAS